MNIILFGPPGAGKGTQGDNLVKDYNLFKVSTGDLLREESKKSTSLGSKIKFIIDQGQLVSDDIINSLIENIVFNKNSSNRLIFDGYPRNLQQAQHLNNLIVKSKQKIDCVINLKVDENIISKRILGRQVCSKCGLIFNEFLKPATKSNHSCDPSFLSKRADDNEQTIKSRFATYSNETLPILEFYRNQHLLYEIDGKGEISEIYKEICRIITSLET